MRSYKLRRVTTCIGYLSLQKVQLPAATVSLIRKCFLTYNGMAVAGQVFREAVKPFPGVNF